MRNKLYVSLAFAACWLAGCTDRPPATDYPRSVSYAIDANTNTTLKRTLAPAIAAHSGQSGFRLVNTGTEALLTRIAMVESAERSVDLQYFSTREDTTGKLLLESVARASQRGVRVRMLMDNWNLDDFKLGVVALNAAPNIEIRVFNPYATNDQNILSRVGNVFSRTTKWTRRMHNKALIVDNQAAIMGGRNLGDEYFDAAQSVNFRDVDVLTVGPVTNKISQNFDRYWNSAEAYPIAALNLPESDAQAVADLRAEQKQHWLDTLHGPSGKNLRGLSMSKQLGGKKPDLIWARAELVSDHPDKIDETVAESESEPGERIDELVRNAKEEFIVITPYFVPLDHGVEWLNSLVARGVRVRILTNSLASTDVVPVHAGYSRYRAALVKGGVELYELKPLLAKPQKKAMFKGSSANSLHAKVYMVDRRHLVIGSFNLDPRSIKFNTEQVLVIHSPELCEKVATLFEQIIQPQNSYRLVPSDTVDAPGISLGQVAWVAQDNGQTTYDNLEPQAGVLRTVTNGLFSLLPLDDQL